jgi:hypothetical protein
MSKLEQQIASLLSEKSVTFETQTRMPLDAWPWKVPRSHKPKCDFFLPAASIYVEVKGLMTIYAMAKMSWLCRKQGMHYYILQGTEEDWNPYLNSPLSNQTPTIRNTKSNIVQQINELCHFNQSRPDNVSSISLARLKDYISTRINEYRSWNGEWL